MVKPRSDPQIPGYRILRELGRGGMASVYLAEQKSIEREVALKVMLPELAASDPSFSMRFVREAKIVARLAHPHITAVYDVGVAGPHHYFSMEYVTGGDLKSRIREGMMPKLSFAIARQIASALAFAHAKNYVHRDVKPENILFRQDGTALLSDFGIAKSNDVATQMTATGAVIGTPHYMSPEQAQGHELDHRSDLYSLGIMLYEMLTGSLPYTGSSALSIGIKHLKEPIPQLTPPAHVYQALIDRLLAKNPADRFQSGEEVVAAIDAMVTGAQTIVTAPTVVTKPSATQTTTSPAGTTGTIKQRAPLLIATAVGALLLAGGAVFLMWHETPTPAPVKSESPAKSTVPKSSPSPAVTAKIDPPTAATGSAEKTRLHESREHAQLDGIYSRMQELISSERLSATRLGLAAELLAEATKLAPKDARLKSAPIQIADGYLRLATTKADEKQYQDAEALIRRGLELIPDHRLLLALQKDVTEKQKPRHQSFGGF